MVAVGAPEGETSCGRCFGGCRKIHCPHCGYANPAPGRLLRRYLEKKKISAAPDIKGYKYDGVTIYRERKS